MSHSDSDKLSQRMQRVVGRASGYPSVERLLRIAAQLVDVPSAILTFDAQSPVVVHGPVSVVPPHALRIPLRRATGEVVGELAVFDGAPRAMNEERREALGDVAELIIEQLEMRRTTLLIAADRLASVGTLAAGVAHEINNPLAYVLTNVDFARAEIAAAADRLGADRDQLSEARQALEEAQKGAERVRQIVKSLKTFSRADDDCREPVDVRRVLDLAIDMAVNEIKHRAVLRREYREVPLIEANEARLAQLFLNLLMNALQSLPPGKSEASEILVTTYVDVDGRVVASVRDTGAGIASEVLPRIFDPFFTTKPVGVGTGLGLAICHGIVTSLGGEITVESSIGAGSTFRVLLLPTSRQSVRTPTPTAPKNVRRGRILVVDDEPMIGSSIKRILSSDHDVVVTSGAREAMALLEGGAHFDVILCDLMMPEMTGMELFESLTAQLPEQADRMVFLTGGAFTDRARAFIEARPSRVQHKPFPPGQLRELIARMLAA